MTDKKKGTPRQENALQKNRNFPANSNSLEAQKLRVKTALIEAGSKGQTTIELRENLDIIHPGGRVLELRQEGFDILTRMEKDADAFGRVHRVGRYFLISLPKGTQDHGGARHG